MGIITFSNGYNYGAILQTYALQEFLKQNAFDSVIIDYLSRNFKNRYKLPLFSISPKRFLINLLLIPTELKKRKKIDSFRKTHFTIESFENVYKSQMKYKQFITGSDQVWNPEITGMDDIFLLKWVIENRKKASYAASIGVDNLNEAHKKILRDNLSTFDESNILVREDGAKRIVEADIGIRTEVVCDPTLLLPKEHWVSLAMQNKSKEKYVLVYIFRTTKDKERRIQKFADERGLSIIWMRNPLRKATGIEYVNGLGIEEWLGFFKNAGYVITDSYHGFMFSLIYEKDFTILPLGKDKSHDRFLTVLDRLRLNGRISIDESEWETSHLDYEDINHNLECFISESRDKLLKMLG